MFSHVQLTLADVREVRSFEQMLRLYEAEDRVTINWENGEGRRPAWTSTYKTWPVPGLVARQVRRLAALPDTSDRPRASLSGSERPVAPHSAPQGAKRTPGGERGR